MSQQEFYLHIQKDKLLDRLFYTTEYVENRDVELFA